jgi:hypothetical protein
VHRTDVLSLRYSYRRVCKRLERHPADWAGAGSGAAHLGMHWARVDDAR